MSRNNNNYRFVYSTDGAHKNLCKACGQFPCKCKKPSFVNPADTTLKIRLEKNGRGGKSVCVVFDLPHNPDYFSDIAKKLKAHCGSGGTFKDDKIEIQGDHRDKIKLFLEKLGFKVKLAGG